jgi:lipopolysaccharide export system protein LptC
MLPRMKVLELPAEPRRLAVSAHPFAERSGPPPVTNDRYSRRVALLKRLLPAIGLALLLLIAVWPRLHPLLESVRLRLAVIDLREARELRMVNPRYAGLDRYNRPYVVTAAIGRQVPDRDDVMALERPKAVMTVHGGASVVVTAATGIYQSQAQLLDLFDDVNLVHENGTRFVTRRAHVNLSDNTAEGHDPVEGHGPSGDIAGEGFQILSKGDTIIFTGRSSLLLKGTKPSATPAAPPGLPAEIEKSAAQIETAAAAPIVAEPRPAAAAAGAKEAPKAAARPHTAAKPRLAAKHAAKIPPNSKPAAAKVKRNVG